MKHVDPYSLSCQPYQVMNAKLLLAAPFVLTFTACDPTGASLNGSGIDPLRPPAGNVDTTDYGTDLTPGQFVNAAVDNTAFYKAMPKANQEADKLLTKGTPMKIVALSGSNTKVELDSGEVGFVPTVMISTGDADLGDLDPIDGSVDVHPPIINLDEDVPMPELDPGTAPAELEDLPPVEEPDTPDLSPEEPAEE